LRSASLRWLARGCHTSTIVVSWSLRNKTTWSGTGLRSAVISSRSQLATQVIPRGIWSWGASGFSKESMLKHPPQ
jgi:hypothetical protein